VPELRARIEAGDLSFLDGVGLLGALASQRWFGAKSRDVLDARVVAAAAAPGGPPLLCLAIVEVRFGLQTHELFQLALGFRPQSEGWGEAVVAETGGWTAYDAMADPQLVRELVGLMRREATLSLPDASIAFRSVPATEAAGSDLGKVRAMGVEQSNSSVVLDDRLVLKLYRRLEAGSNPELELLRFLTDQGFANIAPLDGWAALEGHPLDATLAILQRFVRSRGDGWTMALDSLASDPGWLPARAGRLGEVTAGLHNALASNSTDPSFAPEEPSFESVALLSASVDEEIEQVFLALPERESLAPILGRGEEVRDRLRLLSHIGPVGRVIRHHGDYHLGQVLWSEDEDWLVLDFEGEPARSLPERRRKRSPLRDVAGMLRSFAYAAQAAPLLRETQAPEGWEERCRQPFLEAYLSAVEPSLLPAGEAGVTRLLSVFELEKAVYELRYELDNRPDWVDIPVAGILRILESPL
jgi:predicted trehalose synthase